MLCNNARMTDWDDLRYFLAVAREGNVTAASSHLKVNHSTVSRRISAMEARHGVRLFERLPNGYKLTSAGDNIFQLTQEIEEKSLQVERLLFAQDSRLQGKLNITLPHDMANHCILPYFNSFTHSYPDIDINYIVSPRLKNLNAREADIAIRLTASPPDYLIGKKVANLRHGIYRSSLYSTKPSNEDRLILWHFEQEKPKWVKQYFPNAQVAMRVDDLASMYAAVKAGVGLARMPCYLPDVHADEHIFRLDLALKPSTWGVWVLSHKDLRDTRRVKICKDFLNDILIRQKALFEGELSVYSEKKLPKS